ncbi:MAG: peptide deformylase [Desulfobacteraceae bacterium]|jgi:peptide deformylase
MKIKDVIVQKGEACDLYLTRKLFPVNMRLYKVSEAYRSVVKKALSHMREFMTFEGFEDYPKLYGISGANVGIPWNLVIVRSGDKLIHMINPTVEKESKKEIVVKSNCGSLNLPEKVKVPRHAWVIVSYYTLEGCKRFQKFVMDKSSAGTIQHEIDHNNGILITDY